MKIENEVLLDFDDVLIKPKRSVAASRASVLIDRQFYFYHSNKHWNGLPVMASNMSCTGTVPMALALAKYKAITCIHKFNTKLGRDTVDNEYIWISTGMEDSDAFKAWQHTAFGRTEGSPNLCVDVANGYTNKFADAVKRYRERFPNSVIMAGNVATPEMVMQLILAGADIVKIGIGPGKACQTRMVAGVGVPQLSAIIECADAAHGLKNGDKRNGLICADGGMASPADVCKAFGAGADFVMLGSMLAGTDECEGKWDVDDTQIRLEYSPAIGKYVGKPIITKTRLRYYGMSSYEAQREHYGESKSYRATEGKVLYADYKGSVDTIIKEIIGGLRSCCAYTGADSIRDLSKCTTFVRVNRTHRTPEWRIE